MGGGAGHQDDGPLPGGLGPEGPRPLRLGDRLVGVHPGDLHVAAGGDGLHPVLGLAPPEREDPGAEPEEVFLDLHPEDAGRGHVARLVDHDHDDQGGDEQQDSDRAAAHRVAPDPAAMVADARSRAHASTSRTPSRLGAMGSWASSTRSTTSGMPRYASRPSRNALTATSLAAFSTAG